MAVVGDIVVNLIGKTSQFDAVMRRAQQKLGAFAAVAEQKTAVIGAAVQRAGANLAKLAPSIAAGVERMSRSMLTAVGGGVSSFGRQVQRLPESLSKMATSAKGAYTTIKSVATWQNLSNRSMAIGRGAVGQMQTAWTGFRARGSATIATLKSLPGVAANAMRSGVASAREQLANVRSVVTSSVAKTQSAISDAVRNPGATASRLASGASSLAGRGVAAAGAGISRAAGGGAARLGAMAGGAVSATATAVSGAGAVVTKLAPAMSGAIRGFGAVARTTASAAAKGFSAISTRVRSAATAIFGLRPAASTASASMLSLRNVTYGLVSSVRGLLGAMAPLAVLFSAGAFISSGAAFNNSMRQSTAVMGDLSAAMQGQMRTAALDVAKTTQFSASEAAKGFYYLASAGLTAEQQIAALPAVARFAQAGQFDLARATELSMDALKSLGLESKDPAQNMLAITRTTDVLARATTLANATTEQFAVGLAKAGPSLRMYNKSMEEGTAVLSVYADQGIKAEEAGTAISQVLRDLSRSATKFPAAFRAAGISVYDAGGNMRNVADIVADFEARMAGLSDQAKTKALMDLGVPFKSVRALLALVGKSDAIRTFQRQLQQAGGYAKDVAERQMSPLHRGMQAIGAVATDLGARFQNALGVVLGPALQFAASGIQNLYGWLSATFSALANSPVGEFIADFAKVAGIGAVLIGIIALAPQVGAALAAAFAIVTGPLGAVIALAAILGAVVVETTGKGETFGEKMRDVFASIPEVIETLSFAFRNFGAIAQIAIIDLVTSAIELFPQMEGPLTTVAEFFISTFSGLKAFFSTIIQNIIGALKEVANFARAVGAGLKSAWDAISTGNFKEVSERFGKAFTETLAAQANVAAPNAFEAFRDAYAKAGTEFNASIKQGGGLRNTLDARRRQLLDQVAKTETARQAKVPTSKAIPAAQMIIERAQPKAEPVEEARKVSAYEATAAATRGSSEAWSRIVSAMAGPGQAAKADEQTAENTKEMLDGIHELVRIGRDGRTELVNL